jgi:hypothetical protein
MGFERNEFNAGVPSGDNLPEFICHSILKATNDMPSNFHPQ